MKPYYILRLDKVDDALPKGRASVAHRLLPEELHVAPRALAHMLRKLDAFIAAHEQGIGE
jgi:hypothetical protein